MRRLFDTSVAHVARVYNYWLGGKDNFAADRAAAEQAMAAFPDIVLSARANRAFLRRSVTYLARNDLQGRQIKPRMGRDHRAKRCTA